MSKPPAPSKPGTASAAAARKPTASQDFFLDPLPVPDATESNTDTVWGLWEHSQRTQEAGEEPTQAADLQDFPDTVLADVKPGTDKAKDGTPRS